VGVAVVGCGHWGRNLVRNFAELRSLRAVVDADDAVAAEFGARFGVPALTFPEVLARDDIRAVATASPAALHYDIARQAIAAGKHVFIEKPIALTVEDGEALREQARRAGMTLMVGHLLQYHPAYRKLRSLVSEGAIGRLRYVYSNRLSMGKLRTEEDVLWSFAPHDISMILGLADGEMPSGVAAHSAEIVSSGMADSTHLHLAFPSGLKAHVFVSWVHPFKEHRLVAVGELGCLVFDDTRPQEEKLMRTDYRIVSGPALARGDAVPVPVAADEPLKMECDHFLRAIETSSAPLTDASEALAVLRVLNAADDALVRSRSI
jgi:UDP-2-acetamido-3-amino-2,3-dideoxy-glucuronate N-acetyltransferase